MRTLVSLTLFLLADSMLAQGTASFADPLPGKFQERRERFRTLLEEADHGSEAVLQWVAAREQRRWKRGSTLSVAFHGASRDVWAMVEQASQPWFARANIAASFVDENGDYRTWQPGQTQWTADIRIAFAGNDFWSLVGNESADPLIVSPGEASMNLGSFDRELPWNWQSIVLHEFGHALGFEHEHQHAGSTCKQELKWEPDDDYEETWYDGFLWHDDQYRSPGVLLHFSSAPYEWSAEAIAANLFSFPASRRYATGPYDRDSIMKYSFSAFLFHDPPNALCNTPDALALSDGDKQAIVELYGRRTGLGVEDDHRLFRIEPTALGPHLRAPFEQLIRNVEGAARRGILPP